MQKKLKPHKSTFKLTATNHNKLLQTIQKIHEDHGINISRTELLNIAISELYTDIDENKKTLIETLQKYNIL